MLVAEGRREGSSTRSSTGVRLFECARTDGVVQLSFAAHNLPNSDALSLSDPFCVIYKVSNGTEPVEVCRTETVWNDLNPRWVTSLDVGTGGVESENALLRLEVYDRDAKSELLGKQDFLGGVTFRLKEVLASPLLRMRFKLVQPDAKKENKAWVSVLATKLNYPDDARMAKITTRVAVVRKKTTSSFLLPGGLSKLSGSAPIFFVLYTDRVPPEQGGAGVKEEAEVYKWVPVHRSEVLSSHDTALVNGKYVRFGSARMNMQALNNSDIGKKVKLEVMVFDRQGGHECVGVAAFDVKTAMDNTPVSRIELVAPAPENAPGVTSRGIASGDRQKSVSRMRRHSGGTVLTAKTEKVGQVKVAYDGAKDGVFSLQLQVDFDSDVARL